MIEGDLNPGDVVTMASGGDRWIAVRWEASEQRGMFRKDVPGGEPVTTFFSAYELRKVEPAQPAGCKVAPEPPAPEPRPNMDEETAALLRNLVADAVDALAARLEEKGPRDLDVEAYPGFTYAQTQRELDILRRWLDGRPPTPAPSQEMDEETRAALAHAARVWLDSNAGPAARFEKAARTADALRRWLDGQRGS